MAAVRVGLAGLGWAASGHVPAVCANPNVEVVAACTRKTPEQAQAFVGAPIAVYADYEAFLQHPGLEVVAICTPHHLHAPQTLAAAQAGKHLILEKPMAEQRPVKLAELPA